MAQSGKSTDKEANTKPTSTQASISGSQDQQTTAITGSTSPDPTTLTTTPPPTSSTPGSTPSTGLAPTPPSSSGGTISSAPKTYEISYTSSCYSPVNITIKKGDTVRFSNKSTRDMWPASDSHPSHDIYSAFDANNNIDPGGAYSFTFSEVGAWGYHDHLKPNCGGVITVQ